MVYYNLIANSTLFLGQPMLVAFNCNN